MSNSETDTIKELYSAINRNDIPAVMNLLAPEIERMEPPGFPDSGTYRGHDEVKAHFTSARATWAEGACEPEEIIIEGSKAIALVHVRVKLKNKEDWVDGRVADGFIIRNGKIILFRTFMAKQEALQWLKE